MKLYVFLFLSFLFQPAKRNFSIANLSMNEVVVGVANPISVAVDNGNINEISLKTNNGEISRAGNIFIYIPRRVGLTEIDIYQKEKLVGTGVFRAKNLPAPTAYIGNKRGGSIKKSLLLTFGALIAILEDENFEAPFKILDYCIAIERDSLIIETNKNFGNRYTPQTIEKINKLQPADIILFYNIRTLGPGGYTSTASPIEMAIIDE